MSDWSAYPQATPTHIHTVSRFSPCTYARLWIGGFTLGAATWVANLAVFVPIRIPFPYLVQRVFWINGSTITTTNVDCGLYSIEGSKLLSSGSIAMVGATTIQYASVTPILLNPGRYYMAWTCNNTTSRAYVATVTAPHGEMSGLQQQATALPLPAAMTPAVYAGQGWPICGITRTASGY